MPPSREGRASPALGVAKPNPVASASGLAFNLLSAKREGRPLLAPPSLGADMSAAGNTKAQWAAILSTMRFV